MKTKSDVVVIATPIKRVDLSLNAELPGVIARGNPIPAVTIQTTFRVTTSTGKLQSNGQFVFVHHREVMHPVV
jgi:hypothetical protein